MHPSQDDLLCRPPHPLLLLHVLDPPGHRRRQSKVFPSDDDFGHAAAHALLLLPLLGPPAERESILETLPARHYLEQL